MGIHPQLPCHRCVRMSFRSVPVGNWIVVQIPFVFFVCFVVPTFRLSTDSDSLLVHSAQTLAIGQTHQERWSFPTLLKKSSSRLQTSSLLPG
jgi:hypothetical protein